MAALDPAAAPTPPATHGVFDRLSGSRPQVLADLRIDALGVDWTRIRVLIDTGSVSSAVHADDAISALRIGRAELVADNWPASEQTQLGGVGGLLRYRRLPAAWRFPPIGPDLQEVDGADFLEIDDAGAEVHLGEYRDPFSDEGAGQSNGLSAILGWDVLQHFRLTLDRPDNLVMLAARPPAGT